MSGAEQVESFNPLIVLIWLTQLVILYLDYSQDGRVLWSIPVIGSFLIIQVYMVWKTNYDKMMDDQRDQQMQALGGPTNVPEIVPGQGRLKDLYKTEEKKTDNKKPEHSVFLNNPPAEDE